MNILCISTCLLTDRLIVILFLFPGDYGVELEQLTETINDDYPISSNDHNLSNDATVKSCVLHSGNVFDCLVFIVFFLI